MSVIVLLFLYVSPSISPSACTQHGWGVNVTWTSRSWGMGERWVLPGLHDPGTWMRGEGHLDFAIRVHGCKAKVIWTARSWCMDESWRLPGLQDPVGLPWCYNLHTLILFVLQYFVLNLLAKGAKDFLHCSRWRKSPISDAVPCMIVAEGLFRMCFVGSRDSTSHRVILQNYNGIFHVCKPSDVLPKWLGWWIVLVRRTGIARHPCLPDGGTRFRAVCYIHAVVMRAWTAKMSSSVDVMPQRQLFDGLDDGSSMFMPGGSGGRLKCWCFWHVQTWVQRVDGRNLAARFEPTVRDDWRCIVMVSIAETKIKIVKNFNSRR